MHCFIQDISYHRICWIVVTFRNYDYLYRSYRSFNNTMAGPEHGEPPINISQEDGFFAGLLCKAQSTEGVDRMVGEWCRASIASDDLLGQDGGQEGVVAKYGASLMGTVKDYSVYVPWVGSITGGLVYQSGSFLKLKFASKQVSSEHFWQFRELAGNFHVGAL